MILTVYGGGINPSPMLFNSRSRSKLSWLVAMDGSELAFTNCCKLPNDNDVDGPGLNSRSDSGLEAYDRRDVVIGNRKSSDNDSTGWFFFFDFMNEWFPRIIRIGGGQLVSGSTHGTNLVIVMMIHFFHGIYDTIGWMMCDEMYIFVWLVID